MLCLKLHHVCENEETVVHVTASVLALVVGLEQTSAHAEHCNSLYLSMVSSICEL